MQAGPGSDGGGSEAGGGGVLDAFEDEGGLFAEINITPLTDVFLVLLIILMVVSTSVIEEEKDRAYEKGLLAERALQVSTPEGAGDSDLVPDDVAITVLPDRTVFIDDEEVALADLDGRLQAMHEAAPTTRIVLRADETAPYAVIMDVMARCTRAGLRNIALASRDE